MILYHNQTADLEAAVAIMYGLTDEDLIICSRAQARVLRGQDMISASFFEAVWCARKARQFKAAARVSDWRDYVFHKAALNHDY